MKMEKPKIELIELTNFVCTTSGCPDNVVGGGGSCTGTDSKSCGHPSAFPNEQS